MLALAPGVAVAFMFYVSASALLLKLVCVGCDECIEALGLGGGLNLSFSSRCAPARWPLNLFALRLSACLIGRVC